ncbi:MAG: S-methyl-5'-thioadenosine phosphorylase [Nitrospinota bacterium]
MGEALIGVIGGSGLYQMEGFEEAREVELKTPFGSPSGPYLLGRLEGRPFAFLPRHGKGHRLMPSELPFRANIWGFKKLGAQWIIAVSAVGSLREEIEPGHIVIPDQFFDRTRTRVATFFGDGIAGHITFADPICMELAGALNRASRAAGAIVHRGGTYVCMEGPAFSTRAESRLYRSWGLDVVGMTNIPEAKLAREAELCYATLALATDYDCWHESEEDVTIEAVLEVIKKNVAMAQKIIRGAAREIGEERPCACSRALENAILTSPELIPAEVKERLSIIIGKYIE